VDFVALDVEVPKAVVGRALGELETFFEFVQAPFDAQAFESRTQRIAEQLEQQLKVHVPGAARQRIGEPEDAGGHIAHAEGNHEHRADLQLREALTLDHLIPARRRGVADLRKAQVFETAS
jgi:hypothetical protein